ncbi:heat shock protein Hsp90 [Exidia glandulosa HHB12029]|uniref:Heat shock protein Hsp90 n=1 Tax=Exidia glandulosa HHB12029 TaxID=1314781 RepID=A0A165QVK2_EXIGL|nr:heat shock protein Hsp90 [Exidia glandulosa HHB12029]
MRFLSALVLAASLASRVLAQEAEGATPEKLEFQSDVARLRKIVINSLYSHRDVFLRELISNANDAIEKLRLTALKDKSLVDPDKPLNITLKMVKDEEDESVQRKLIITDTGIGMAPEELKANLGTLAKSGTSEFLAKADGENAGNLIGQFGVGFYSSFLVASHVYVASRSLPTAENPNPVQHVFSSDAEEGSFEVYLDPRGNTLEHGTEITLILKKDAKEYAESATIQNLVEKHSAFSTTFPIFLFDRLKEEVPVEDEEDESAPADAEKKTESEDDDDAIIEDVTEKPKEKKMKTILTDHWMRLNEQPPLWQRDPKSVTDQEYKDLYKATFHDYSEPLAWYHFSGDAMGTAFKAIFYVPSHVPADFWNSGTPSPKDIRLLVKRVFITNDLGEDALPKWISWIKIIVDADDLPLNVSRETLQNTRFLRQLKNAIMKRFIQLMTKIAEEEPERFTKINEQYNPIFKLGALEDEKDSTKLAALIRYDTNTRDKISLEEYVSNRKKGQKQIFYLAGMGQRKDDLLKSVFLERLTARGYEVLLFNEPLDEILVNKLRKWGGMKFQDSAKSGLKFGDEEEDEEEEKERQKVLEEQYKPLLDWLTTQTKGIVADVKVSQRLVTSPCAIVAHQQGMSANMERLMKAQTQKTNAPQAEWAKGLKTLEINPKSPLIEGLLRRVENLPAEEADQDAEVVDEMKEVAAILIDSALVRSGFEVADPNIFFTRIDHVLRRSLGVSEKLEADKNVKPAPPVETGPLKEDDDEPDLLVQPGMGGMGDIGADFVDWKDFKAKREAEGSSEPEDSARPHDEL